MDFQSSTGQSYTLPDDLSPDEQEMILNRLITESGQIAKPPDVLGPLNPPMQPSAKEKAEIQLGRPLARDTSGALAEFNVPGLRADLAWSTSRDQKILTQEKLLKLKDRYPEYQFEVLNEPIGSGMWKENIVVIPPGEDPILLDSDELTTLSDFAEVGGMLLSPHTFTALAAAIRTRGATLATRIFGQALGGAAGESIQSGVEGLRGYQLDPLDNIAGDILVVGAIGGTAEAAISPARKLINAVRGGGFIKLTPEEEQVVRLFREHEIRGPTGGMLHPLASTMELQTARTSKVVQNFHNDMMKDVLKDFNKARTALGNPNISDQELSKILNSLKDDILAVSQFRPIYPEISGRALQHGRELFVKAARKHLNTKYDRALAAGKDAHFDISDAQQVAKEILEGTQAKSATGDAVRFGDISPELKDLAERILKIDPSIQAYQGNTAFEIIQKMRTEVFDLKHATMTGKENNSNRLAGRLWDSLTKSMNEPIGGDARFKTLLRVANNSNRWFEDILEYEALSKIANTVDPGNLTKLIARPGKSATLRLLRRVMPSDQWQKFRGGFINEVISKGEEIEPFLNKFKRDPSALRLLLSPQEENVLRGIGVQSNQLKSNPIQQILRKGLSDSEKANALITKGSVKELNDIILKSGGKDSQVGQGMRVGVFDYILKNSKETRKGAEVINPKTALRVINDLDKKGILESVMTPNEVKFMKDHKMMLSFMDKVVDTGASIQAAEIGAQVMSGAQVVIHPAKATSKFINGVSSQFRNALVGRLFISERGRQILVGIGNTPWDLTKIRAFSAALAETLYDMQRTTVNEPKDVKAFAVP